MAKEFDLPEPVNNLNFKLEKNAKEKRLFLDEIDKAAFSANTKDEEAQIEKAILDIVKNADSFEEVYENMLQAFPGADIDAIEDTLEKIIANAHIKGML